MSRGVTFLNSIGIDIGTTTTQVIFSRLWVANAMPQRMTPRLEITKREVLYRGEINFTPLLDQSAIDAKRVRAIIDREFKLAGLNKADIDTGAVIITGQSVKKNNASQIAHMVADITGNFVVAVAGPHIESFLAGKGSGAAERSKKTGTVIANIDIGGGTSNIAVIKNGVSIDSACLNIGGRLVRIQSDGVVTHISQDLKQFLQNCEIDITEGQQTALEQLSRMADLLALALYNAVFAGPAKDELCLHVTERLSMNYHIEEIMFSGGVADYILNNSHPASMEEISRYGDFGPLLGAAVRKMFAGRGVPFVKPVETIRATVLGAGAQSLRVSGSTVFVNSELLPLKNIPVIKIVNFDDPDIVTRSISAVIEESTPAGVALGIGKIAGSSFAAVRHAAGHISKIINDCQLGELPVIVISTDDFGLVLGQTIAWLTGNRNIMCIDQVAVDEGDYIDIGLPIDGKAVPVVIKTLVFN